MPFDEFAHLIAKMNQARRAYDEALTDHRDADRARSIVTENYIKALEEFANFVQSQRRGGVVE